MDADDAPIGFVLSRRKAVGLLSTLSLSVMGGGLSYAEAALAAGGLPPACIARPRQTEGPYFVDEKLNRSDIRSDPGKSNRAGAQLDLNIEVMRIGNGQCAPLSGAIVDIWQCDALGVYSDVRDTQGRFDTVGQKFLRGHQVTNAKGSARFVTIYPGWYQGRTVHIHFKIRTSPAADAGYDFTSQLYFDDAFTDRVMRLQPYAGQGERSTRNAQDGIFRRSGGEQLMLDVKPKGEAFTSTFAIGLQMT
jgi:protocatechuate 3,4-dioxygenase beta subunit